MGQFREGSKSTFFMAHNFMKNHAQILPHQLLAYLWLLAGQHAKQLVKDHHSKPLFVILAMLKDGWRKNSNACTRFIFYELKALEVELKHKGRERVQARFDRELPDVFFDSVIGDTTFGDYLMGNGVEAIYTWSRTVEMTLLIPLAIRGDHSAFEALVESHQRSLQGFIGSRLDTDADLGDLLNTTWSKVWEKIATFDPARASFYTWIRIWAGYTLAQYYHRRKQRSRFEITLSELIGQMSRGGVEMTEEELLGLVKCQTEDVSEPDPKVTQEFRQVFGLLFDGKNDPECLLSFILVKVLSLKPRHVFRDWSKLTLTELTKKAKGSLIGEG